VNDEEKYTLSEADRRFAVQYHGQTWDMLEKSDRNADDDELMVHTAHASCRHWLAAGTPVHHQRGEWLIARVYTVLGIPGAAQRHARRCLTLTEEHAAVMEDFDVAFAYEGMARALALAGDRDEAARFLALAEQAGEAIGDAEDREAFLAELNGGSWYSVR
jgi:hypothetical protein